jgi:hypothetical protein
MKMREGPSDTSLREFSISANGIDVSSTFESAEAIVTGVAHVAADSPGKGGRHQK